jgi:S-formylglutathione hydrolase FrmB
MKMLQKTCFSFLFLILFVNGYAASVDSIEVYSSKMKRSIKTIVIKPTLSKDQSKQLPVLYLLHGAFGAYNNWILKVPHIKNLADQYGIMIVCPDGGFTSWYFDSPIDSTYQYETFVANELVKYIDTHYPTIANRNARAISGLSMGGHGAMFLSFRHADIFGACASTSGALHVSVITQGYGVEKRLGDPIINKQYWNDWSILNIIEHYPKDSLAILIDCGTEDRVLAMNRAVHVKLNKLKVPHDYIERPGEHNFIYWNKSIDYHFVFFSQFFNKGIK